MKKYTLDSEIFKRGVATIVTREELRLLLKSGRPLRIKHGIDATSGELHLGHAASLWKLRELQEAGHKAVILFGDTTTAIGDPTGRFRARPVLSAAAIAANLRSIEKQIQTILLASAKVYESHRSSEWYGKMAVPKFLHLLSLVTHARLIERDMFQARIRSGGEILAHELIYPILQGYDSVMLKADLTIVGQDQLFNEHLGRHLQGKFGQVPQAIAALSLLPGLDGVEKMSKSLGNYIGLRDLPGDKFGKAMRIPDKLIVSYLEHYTDVPLAEIASIAKGLAQKINPRDAKLFLAEALVRRYHGEGAAKKEREKFLSLFSRHEIPADVPTAKLPPGPAAALDVILRLGFARSKSEGRRLIGGGAVEIDGEVIVNPAREVKLKGGEIIRVGKRKVARIL